MQSSNGNEPLALRLTTWPSCHGLTEMHTIYYECSCRCKVPRRRSPSQRRCISFTHSHTRAHHGIASELVWVAPRKSALCDTSAAEGPSRLPNNTDCEWEPRREWPTDCYYYFKKQMSLDTPRSKQIEWGWTLATGLGTLCIEKLLAQSVLDFQQAFEFAMIDFIGD
jgi:hypothetical protein